MGYKVPFVNPAKKLPIKYEIGASHFGIMSNGIIAIKLYIQ